MERSAENQQAANPYRGLNIGFIEQVDFSNADLSNARLVGYISGADFEGSDVSGATLKGISRQQLESTASFQNRDLRGVTITSGKGFFSRSGRVPMQDWDLTNQDLTNATLGSVDATGANFDSALLTSATLSTGTFDEGQFTGVNLDGSEWIFSSAQRARFSSSTLEGSDLRSADLSGASFFDANLRKASLFAADLSFVDFQDVDLVSADLRGTNLRNASLKSTDLRNATLEFATDLSPSLLDETSTINQWTVFPEGFDPFAAGVNYVESPVGDFDASGSVDAIDIELLQSRLAKEPRTDSIQISDNIAYFVNPSLTEIDFIRFPDSGVQGNVFVAEVGDRVSLDDVRSAFDLPDDFNFTLLHTEDLDIYLAQRRKLYGQIDDWLEPMFDVTQDGVIDGSDLSIVESMMAANLLEPSLSACVVPAGGMLGDLNDDGHVAFDDFLEMSLNFGRDGVGYRGGDVNCDGSVRFDDFLTLSTNFGLTKTAATIQSVPEPMGVVHLLIAVSLLCKLDRHRRAGPSARRC